MINMKEQATNGASFRVVLGGGIIQSLTQELPNDMLALRELIKNAYDASADKVRICLDSVRRTLTIEDNGDGMSAENMKSLFHIGRSKKHYGRVFTSTRSQELRCTQGSKGVGFLAAMHFGSYVYWASKKEGSEACYTECDREYLKGLDDLSMASLEIHPHTRTNRGTLVKVALDDYRYANLVRDFQNPEIIAKICNTFRQSQMKVSVVVDGLVLSAEHVADFAPKSRPYRQYYVRISDEKKSVEIYYGESLVEAFDYPKLLPECRINGEIVILNLEKGRVSAVTDLFLNQQNTLTPLIYINDNLFEDYSLFNPEIHRKKRSSAALPQMLGYIDINCHSEALEFNADRTHLVQNHLSDSIRSFLKEINSLIQTKASAHKKTIPKEQRTKHLGFDIPSKTRHVCGIVFKGTREHEVMGPPLYLLDYVHGAYDSQLREIPKEKIHVYVDDIELPGGLLPSQQGAGTLRAVFKYEEDDVGTIANTLELNFKKVKVKPLKPDLLPHAIVDPRNSYAKVCKRLMEQMNALNAAKYTELIACGLRSIFELSVYSMRNVPGLPKELRRAMSVEQAITTVFKHILGNAAIHQRVAQNSKIGFDDLKNFEIDKFVTVYKTSHRGAHKSSALLTTGDIYDIGKRASEFAHIVSVLLLLYRDGEI